MSIVLVDFCKAKNIQHLATMIGCEDQLIDGLLASESREEFYCKLHIPKKNIKRLSAFREVWKAKSIELAKAQKSLLRCFENFAKTKLDGRYPHPASHGFISKRSIITNARVHVGRKYLLRLDIHEYFNSISSQAIFEFLRKIGIGEVVANGITALTTINNSLGQGINTSPLFANLVSLDLDEELNQLASEFKCLYTRYADDLSFSGENEVPPKDRIQAVLTKYGFRLSPDKCKYSKNGQAHFVTGLSISNSNGPFVPKKFKHRLRQELHYAEKYGIQGHSDRTNYFSVMQCINSIDGRINFLKSVEPQRGLMLRTRWYEILSKEDLLPNYKYAVERVFLRKVSFYVDETVFKLGKNSVMGLALVITELPEKIRASLEEITQKLLADPYVVGDKEALQEKGLHFTENSDDMRLKAVQEISKLPFQAYVAYKTLDDKNDSAEYKKTYLELLKILVSERLGNDFSSKCSISIEQNPQINKTEIKTVFTNTIDELKVMKTITSEECPTKLDVNVVGKTDKCLALADYTLGAIRYYLTKPDTDYLRAWFERLRDHVRLIYDLDNQKRYTRKNPLVSNLEQ